MPCDTTQRPHKNTCNIFHHINLEITLNKREHTHITGTQQTRRPSKHPAIITQTQDPKPGPWKSAIRGHESAGQNSTRGAAACIFRPASECNANLGGGFCPSSYTLVRDGNKNAPAPPPLQHFVCRSHDTLARPAVHPLFHTVIGPALICNRHC